MRKDYHMHPRVIEGYDRVERFIETAINNNFDEICITDHMPLSCSDAADRIKAGGVSEYYKKVRELADIYKDKISIKCGIEIDYHPSVVGEIEEVLSQGDFDFILGSTHIQIFADYLLDGNHKYTEFADLAWQNTLLAAKSGYFTTISHLDMFRWAFTLPERFPLIDDGYTEDYHRDIIEEILDVIEEKNLYLEINPHLAWKNEKNFELVYPHMDIVKSAFTRNIKFSYGSDAHVASQVGKMYDMLREHPIYSKALSIWENEKN